MTDKKMSIEFTLFMLLMSYLIAVAIRYIQQRQLIEGFMDYGRLREVVVHRL